MEARDEQTENQRLWARRFSKEARTLANLAAVRSLVRSQLSAPAGPTRAENVWLQPADLPSQPGLTLRREGGGRLSVDIPLEARNAAVASGYASEGRPVELNVRVDLPLTFELPAADYERFEALGKSLA